GLGLDHQHGVLGTGHDHVQAGSLELLVGRVQQVAAFRMEGHARSADRAVERNAGDRQRSRGTDHRGDVRVGLLAGRYHGADDLHFILETFREQRADRTIDQTRGQGFLLGGTRLTLEEAARDLAGSVGGFRVVDRQRETALARVGGLGPDHGDQHAHVVIDGDQHGAGGLASDTARLQGYGRLTELKFLDYRVHGVFLLSVAFGGNRQNARESARSFLQESRKLEARSCKRVIPGFQLPASSFRLPTRYVLTTQTQTTDQGAVTSSVLALQVIQQLAALVDHADQTTTGVVVLAVGLEVVLQLVDVGGQQCNLHFRRTGIAFSLLVLVND